MREIGKYLNSIKDMSNLSSAAEDSFDGLREYKVMQLQMAETDLKEICDRFWKGFVKFCLFFFRCFFLFVVSKIKIKYFDYFRTINDYLFEKLIAIYSTIGDYRFENLRSFHIAILFLSEVHNYGYL